MTRGALLPVLLLAPALALGEDHIRWDVEPEALVRRVALAQKAADDGLADFTFDQRIVETRYDGKGRPKTTSERLFYVTSGKDGAPGTRELVAIDGRPATEAEKKAAAEEDAKREKKRVDERAAARAREQPKVAGDDDDPLVGDRRLSDLLDRFTYRLVGEEVVEGRPAYVLEFRPRPGSRAKSLGERAVNTLAGRAVIDASDFQIREIEAWLTKPVKVAGGLAANVGQAWISYHARPVSRRGLWFPCQVDLRMKGKTAIFFPLDARYRFELTGFRTFAVDVDAAATVAEPAAAGPERGAPEPERAQ